MKKTLFLFSFLAFQWMNGQLLFQDNFATYNTAVQLSGQGVWTNNSSNPGGLGSCAGFGCPNAKVLATPINYMNFGESVNSFEIKPDTDGCGRSITATNSGSIYIGMVLNLTSASGAATPGDFFRVMSGGNFSSTFKMYAKGSGTGFLVGFSKGSSSTITYAPMVIDYNFNHLIVFKYTFNPGTADDVISLFVDPIFSGSEPAFAAQIFSGTDTTGSIDRLSFRQNSATAMPSGNVGLISVATSWSALSFPQMAVNQFDKTNFVINTNNCSTGILEIKSISELQNATLKVFGINGNLLFSKKIKLIAGNNEIGIEPILGSTACIIEIVSANNQRFVQKAISK